jgi:hypothetical protein
MQITQQPNGMQKVYMIITALVCWFALVLQLYLIIVNAPANNITATTAVINYISFYTITTNILVALACTLPLTAPSSGAGKFFSRAAVQSGVALSIMVVGITYSLLLRNLWNPQGGQKIADVLLHDAVPLLYTIYWFLFVPKGVLQWKNVPYWLIYPLVYIIYTLIRGGFTGRYPYPFLDVVQLGYSKMFVNAGFMTLGFVVLGLLLVAINRLLARKTATAY